MKNLIAFAALAVLIGASCKKDKSPAEEPSPSGPSYSVPTTYNFSNVNYSGQSTRMNMVAELKTYLNTGNTQGTTLSTTVLLNMYQNQNAAFSDTALNNSGKNIKSKVFSLDQNLFETFFDSVALASQSSVAGSNGVAGVVVSVSNPSKKYLCDKNGVEWTQVIEKGLMGALMYYQTTAYYLDAAQIGNSVDNTTVTPGEGTAMEHHWDEAFGYFGVPIDFPTNTTGIRFWGKYCNDRNAILSCNSAIMNAFLTGRAAISNKDYTKRDEQVTAIRDNWEKVIAATIISYVNSTKLNISDDAIRNHNCSEIKGFLMNLKYNPTRKITLTQLSQIEGYLGSNFYNITLSNLDLIKDTLSTIYGMDNIKNTL
jgi:hypothetical protein